MTPHRFFLMLSMLLSGLCLSACLLGPEYDRTALRQAGADQKSRWAADVGDAGAAPPLDREWWKSFGDPLVNRFVEEALAGNPDLGVRLLRVRDADLQLRRKGANRLPRLNQSGNASYYWRRQERIDVVNDPIFDPEEDFQDRLEESTTEISDSEYYNLGLSLSWELDLWGKKKRGYLGAEAGYAESRAQYAGEYLRVVAEIAQTVFDIRKQDKEIHILARLHPDAQQRWAALRAQHAEGLLPEWRVLRQRVEVDRLAQERSGMVRERQRLTHRLARLVGRNPGALSVPDTAGDPLPAPMAVPAGLPADLLARRPDLIAAEYRVEKAVHRIGETLAARLPTITLTGQAGLANTALPDLLKQWTLGLTPSLSFPVFDGGSRKLQVASAEIQAQIARIQYRNAVLKAFEEVENLLSDIAGREDALDIARAKAAAMERIRSETQEKFQMGLVSQLELLDAEREWLSAKRSLLQVRRSRLDDAISLAKAMGGGWSAAILSTEAVAANADDGFPLPPADGEGPAAPVSIRPSGSRLQLQSLVLEAPKRVRKPPVADGSGPESEDA